MPIPATYRPDIDGLRAVAIIIVIVNHFNERLLPGGFLGVDVFFVISGYVITASLFSREPSKLGGFLVGFYARRMRRLLPALITFILSVSLLICFFNPAPELALRTGRSAVFGFSNLFLYRNATDYFAPSEALNPFLHTWSLGVEEQFYFVYPLIFWVACKFFVGIKHQLKSLALIMTVLSLGSIAYYFFTSVHDPSAAYFLMPSRFWEMGFGCLSYSIVQLISVNASNATFIVGSLLLPAVLILNFANPVLSIGTATLLVSLSTAVLIPILPSLTFLYGLLSGPFIVFIGSISYSLYLWHWGVLSLARWTIGISPITSPILIATISSLSLFSYRAIETPFRLRSHWGNYIVFKTFVFAFLALASALGSTTLLLSRSVGQMTNPLFTGTPLKLRHHGPKSLQIERFPSTAWNGRDCWFSPSAVSLDEVISNCTFGNFYQSERRVIVLGNSFAPAFANSYHTVSSKDRYSFTVYGYQYLPEFGKTKAGTKSSSFSGDLTNKFYSSFASLPALDSFTDIISRLRPGDAVLWVADLSELSEISSNFGSKIDQRQFSKGLGDFSAYLRKKNIAFLILGLQPLARDAKCDPATAIPQWFKPFGSSSCRLPDKSKMLDSKLKIDQLINPPSVPKRASIISFFDVFCPSTECDYFSGDGTLLYRDDSSHPTSEIAAKVAPLLEAKLTYNLVP